MEESSSKTGVLLYLVGLLCCGGPLLLALLGVSGIGLALASFLTWIARPIFIFPLLVLLTVFLIILQTQRVARKKNARFFEDPSCKDEPVSGELW